MAEKEETHKVKILGEKSKKGVKKNVSEEALRNFIHSKIPTISKDECLQILGVEECQHQRTINDLVNHRLQLFSKWI